MSLQESQKEFDELSRPLMKFINDKCNPHSVIVIEGTNARLLDGKYSTGTILDYVKD